MPVVAKAMKNARAIVQYFNKSTQTTKKLKLKDQQQESSLAKYIGKPNSRMSRLGGGLHIVC